VQTVVLPFSDPSKKTLFWGVGNHPTETVLKPDGGPE